jgi:hypothetical protein
MFTLLVTIVIPLFWHRRPSSRDTAILAPTQRRRASNRTQSPRESSYGVSPFVIRRFTISLIKIQLTRLGLLSRHRLGRSRWPPICPIAIQKGSHMRSSCTRRPCRFVNPGVSPSSSRTRRGPARMRTPVCGSSGFSIATAICITPQMQHHCIHVAFEGGC